MTTEQVWLGAAGLGVVGLTLVVLVLALLARDRARRAEALVAALVERIDVLESSATDASLPVVDHADEATYVITHLDEPAEDTPLARPIDGRLFADIVARETVVRVASWTHGVRRALAPETRNRIRFQVRQETRRAGRERKAEMKVALREYRRRADATDVSEDVA